MLTRSCDISRTLSDIRYKEEVKFITKLKLQKGDHLIGRMMYLCSVKPGKRSYSQTEASNIVAKELRDDWVAKNVYPLSEKNIANKIKAEYDTFNELWKQYN